jgi:hypothetical protein
MKMRKRDVKAWITSLYGASIRGPLEEAWRLSAQEEVARYEEACLGAVFLDCSKCYERISQAMAADRARESGCPIGIVNLVMGMYGGERRILLDGAISEGIQGHSGLLAGCSFARDVLKSFFNGLEAAAEVQVRDYVDDVVVIVERQGARECAVTLQ